MPLFRYQAFDQKGSVVKGEKEAATVAEAKELLKAEKLMVFKIIRADQDNSFSSIIKNFFEPSIDNKVLVQFTNQLAVLLKSSVPLVDATELLSQQFQGSFKKIIIKIIEDLKGGSSFADALEKYPKIFSKIYVQLVKAGEASGKLEIVLDKLTYFLERSVETDAAVAKAMRGPIINFVAVIAAFAFAVVFILPTIAKTLSQVGQGLPFITELLLNVADFLKNYYWVLGGFLFFSYLIFLRWKNSEKGMVQYHAFLLKIPKYGELTKNRAVVQFSQTLGMLLDAGVNLPNALDIVNNVIDNAILVSELKKAREEIIKEGKIAKHLRNTQIFLPVSIYMMKTGEESGKLAEMLIKVGNDTEVELTESIDGFIAALNPIMTVLMGVLALVFVLAVMLPMFSMSDVNMNI